MTTDLKSDTLRSLPENVKVPSYDRSQVKTGIVHIGPGAFFRGHIAVYVDELLERGDLRWGISAVSLRSCDANLKLEPQDYLYTVVKQKPEGHTARVVGSLKEILVASEDPARVIERMTDPDVKLVTLTVTQNGYYYDSRTGQLDFEHPHIRDCLNQASEKFSTVGLLVKMLEERKARDIPPPVIMSCDNFPNNGTVLRNVVLAYAGHRSKELADWIYNNVDFPSTMVDRIVPKLEEDHRRQVTHDFGINDVWPIFTEPYREWVMEERFRTEVPDFRSVGVQVTKEVEHHELKKIRLLNGVHMAMGAVGYLAGHEYAHEAIADPAIRSFVEGFFDEIKSTLRKPDREDLDLYTETLVGRLSNPHMKDHLTRLARNGSQKVPSRFLSPIREAVAQEKPIDHLCFAVAAWIKYLKGVDPQGRPFDISDEEAFRMGLPELAAQCGDNPYPVLSVQPVFGFELPGNTVFAEKVTESLRQIESLGMAGALARLPRKDLNGQDVAPSVWSRVAPAARIG